MGRESKPCFVTAVEGGALGPLGRQLLQAIELYAGQRGLPAPIVISACRSRFDQVALLNRWIAGDRKGIGARPADPENSKHIPDYNGLCWAFDLGNSREWLGIVGPWVQRNIPYAIWGGIWLPPDVNHFEVEPEGRWSLGGQWKIG